MLLLIDRHRDRNILSQEHARSAGVFADVVQGKRLIDEIPLQRFGLDSRASDDSLFVDSHLNRHPRYLHQVDRIVQDRPIYPVPLRKEPVALRMLLLGYPEHDELAVSDVLLKLLVPGRHGLAATPSPRGEVDQQHFLPAKLPQ